MRSSSARRGTLRYSAECPWRQAYWASAQANHVLPSPGGAGEGQRLAPLDPGRQCDAHQGGPVDAAHRLEAGVLQGSRGVFQLGTLKQPSPLAVASGIDLALDQQGQPLVERQVQAVGTCPLEGMSDLRSAPVKWVLSKADIVNCLLAGVGDGLASPPDIANLIEEHRLVVVSISERTMGYWILPSMA